MPNASAALLCAFFLNGLLRPDRHATHPLPVPIRHLKREAKALSVTQFETDMYIANTVQQIHQITAVYSKHVCGVWDVVLEHGGGSLGIFESLVCITCDQSWPSVTIEVRHFFLDTTPRFERLCPFPKIFFFAGGKKQTNCCLYRAKKSHDLVTQRENIAKEEKWHIFPDDFGPRRPVIQKYFSQEK